MQVSIETLERDMEDAGLVPDVVAAAFALKGMFCDLPFLIACEAARFGLRVAAASAAQGQLVAKAFHVRRLQNFGLPNAIDEAQSIGDQKAPAAAVHIAHLAA
jgi:hypothetical protein